MTPDFRHDSPTVPESAWRAAGLDHHPIARWSGFRHLVVVAAHPDDETLGAAGLINLAARRGLRVTVIVATDGSASHPDSTTHSPAQLVDLRRNEVRSAVADLAPGAELIALGLPDGRLADHTADLAKRLAAAITAEPTLVVTHWPDDGHPDHAAAGSAAREVSEGHPGVHVWQFPIWWWHWGDPQRLPPGLVTVPLDATATAAKKLAMSRHLSQTEPLSDRPGDEVLLSAEFLTHFERPFEMFVDPDDVGSLPAAFFDEFYGDQPDPWGFGSRWYEERKRSITMASLPRRRFHRVFEPGCSIGVLTAELAERSDALLATDISDVPLQAARQRLAQHLHVEVQKMTVPQVWPDGKFDCIILSEIGYYLGEDDLALLVQRLPGSLEPGGIVLACHWRHPVPEYPGDADHVHAELNRIGALHRLVRHEEADFRLEIWSTDDRSVAEREGLV